MSQPCFKNHVRIKMKKQTAELISNVFNPFLIGLLLVLLISFEATSTLHEAIKWSLLLTAINILPVFIFAFYLARHNRVESIFINIRKQRTSIYTLGIILAGVSCIILLSPKAPLMLLALSVTSFSVNVIFMCINLRWKISLHTAFITAAVTLLFILYGFRATASLALVLLVGWARIESDHHSVAQVVAGALLAPAILVTVFHLFGLT